MFLGIPKRPELGSLVKFSYVPNQIYSTRTLRVYGLFARGLLVER